MDAWKTPDWPDLSSLAGDLLCTGNVKLYSMREIMEKSEAFPIKFPVDTGRLKTLKNKKNINEELLTKNVNSAYPFVHEGVLKLYLRFIEFKRSHGHAIEKAFYKDMNLKHFIDRLLKNRAVMFMGRNDQYILISGEKGANNWETIGTDEESAPLTLQNCLSYDEIKLSAFLYVSSYTYFVNKGDRKNKAVFSEDRSQIQDEGVIVGVIGPRVKKQGVMDYQEIIAMPQQNKKAAEYGKKKESVRQLFFEFYGEECRLYEEIVEKRSQNEHRYVDLKSPKGAIFDNQIYCKRLGIAFDCLLIEANARAKEEGKNAYVHVVGLGLGVWKISDHQEKVFMDCFYHRIVALSNQLVYVSDICFSYINQKACGRHENGDTLKIPHHPSGGIKIHIFKREPHEKLQDQGKLLIVSYAWDGNALPGNEFWSGKLASSGDSATASATQIAELHNPHINPVVCADNLKIATSSGEMMPLNHYLKRVAKNSTPSDQESSSGRSSKKSKTR